MGGIKPIDQIFLGLGLSLDSFSSGTILRSFVTMLSPEEEKCAGNFVVQQHQIYVSIHRMAAFHFAPSCYTLLCSKSGKI